MADEILVNRAAMEAAADVLRNHASTMQHHLNDTNTAMTNVLRTFQGGAANAYNQNTMAIQKEIDNLSQLASAAQAQVNSHQEQTFAVDRGLAQAFEANSGVDVTPGN